MADNTQTNVETLLTDKIGIWDEVVDVWMHGFMGVDIGRLIVALLIFTGFLVIRGIVTKYVLYRLHAWTEKSTTQLDDTVVDALIPPIRFIPIILGVFFTAQYLQLDGELDAFISKAIRSMIAFAIFWALHRALGPVQHLSKKLEKLLTKAMANWVFKSIKVLIIFIGAAVILEIWGIEIGPLLAGLGLFGAAVALGAQDLFKNLIGGFTVIAEKRFHPGDWIRVDNVVEGIVEEIGFRSTLVRRFDKAPVYVPNSELSDAVVTNFTRMTNRRIFWSIGVTYSTSKEQLIDIRAKIEEYLTKNEEFAQPPALPLFVRVDCFNASSIDIMVYCFTKTTDWGEFLRVKEDFALALKDIVEGAGSSFAFPSQSVYLESLPEDRPEIFTPPGDTQAA